MSVFATRPALRWLVPVAAAATVAAAGIGIALAAAADEPAPRSAAELLADLQAADLDGVSGTIVYRSEIGLPDLSGLDLGRDESEVVLAFIGDGTRTLRVWYAGPDKARVALLATMGETDIVINGSDVWVWESQHNRAVHRALPDGKPERPTPSASPFGLTPHAVANAVLALLEPSTEVSTSGSLTVADRAAHELVLTPRDPACLIQSVRVAIDAEQRVPLRLQVFARGQDAPAIEVAFTQVSFTPPDESRFTFNPPPGAEVIEQPEADGSGQPARESGGAKVAAVGSGWTTVLALRLPAEPAEPEPGEPGQPSLGRNLDQLKALLPRVDGPVAGAALRTRLFSVLFTDDGRILLGAVSAEDLAKAAADPAAALDQ